MCKREDCRCWPAESLPGWMLDLLLAFYGPLLADVLDFLLSPEDEWGTDADAA